VAQGQEKYRVYLPPCYFETGKRYPYVILMHGSDRDQTEWIDLLGVDKALEAGLTLKALPPMILVMPDGGALANLNYFAENRSWESYILKDLMPEIEKNFCTWNEREGRAIGGISRGGFWAFEIGLRHPDLFSAIGGHSPFFDRNNAPPAYNPLYLARSVQFPPGMQPRIWLDVGRDDYARQGIADFRDGLLERSIDPGYTLNPTGEHTIEYWAAHVAEYLAFYGQTWPRDTQDLPSCLQ
jgi:enterochelin esterase-like enzyme